MTYNLSIYTQNIYELQQTYVQELHIIYKLTKLYHEVKVRISMPISITSTKMILESANQVSIV